MKLTIISKKQDLLIGARFYKYSIIYKYSTMYKYLTTVYKKSGLYVLLSLGSIAMHTNALQAISDTELSTHSGASGIALESSASKITTGNIYWQDGAVNGGSRLNVSNATIVKDNSNDPSDLNVKLTLNQGSNATTPAIDVAATVSPFLLTGEVTKISYGATHGSTGASFGGFSAMALKDTIVSFKNTKGVFNATGESEINVILNGLNLYITQKGAISGTSNQLILGDIATNLLATGQTWVDANNGLRFSGTTLLTPVSAGKAGLELSLKYKGGVSTASNAVQYAYNTSSLDTNGTPIIRFGFSGLIPNTQVSLQGLTKGAGNNNDSTLGNVFDDQSIAFKASGEMSRQGSTKPFSWEIGEASNGNYGFRFDTMVPFSNVQSTSNATFNTGTLYLNQSGGNGIVMGLPHNASLTNATYNSQKLQNNSKSLINNSEYQLSVINDMPLLMVQLRGTEWQGVAQSTRFTTNGSAVATANTTWAFAPLLYGVDGNIVVGGTNISGRNSEAMALQFQLQTKGLSPDNTKTTSLLLVDTALGGNGQAYNRYIGFRNIDAYLKGSAQVLFNNNELRLNITDFLLGFDTQLGVGYLPGAQVYTPSGAIAYGQVGQNFGPNSKSDVFYGIRGRFQGSADIGMSTASQNGALTFNAKLNLNNSSFLHLIEPTDSSTFGLDKISGVVALKQATTDINIENGVGSVTFAGTTQFNPNQRVDEVFKVSEVNLYPKGVATPQKLMEIAIPGGQIDASIRLTPR